MENQPSFHVLLAEDNIFNQKVAVAMLKRLGLAVDVAKNGQEVLEKLSDTHHYALIFMDCEMPIMDGFTATAKIRDHEQQSGQHIPIVAMTAHGSPEDRKNCLQSGMDDYVSKPFKLDALQEVLTRWHLAK
ncbi:MAG: hypothetical protein BWK79_18225 [Beggiatoa sp. IS2]|nr:MAG: hypothetical protein BWK79_18225 [Beggiatoa sp. IS2]